MMMGEMTERIKLRISVPTLAEWPVGTLDMINQCLNTLIYKE